MPVSRPASPKKTIVANEELLASNNSTASTNDNDTEIEGTQTKAVSTTATRKSSQQQSKKQSNSATSSKAKNNKTSAARTKSHTVKSGESLDKIARKNGVTVAQLQKANNIKGSKISVGQKIVIPK